jgi:mRNA-degrading endonuclease RelE of RelBE toxin-antitoxin system
VFEKYTLVFDKQFKKSLKRLSSIDQNLVLKKLDIFSTDPRSLQSKKMRGRFGNYESRVNDSIRLIWKRKKEKIIVMIDVGHHDVLRKY